MESLEVPYTGSGIRVCTIGIDKIFQKKLIEALTQAAGVKHFLEVTGGLLTHQNGKGIRYEVFEPSEALASGEILSLEEKSLASEEQNITLAHYTKKLEDYAVIAEQVKATLERAACIVKVRVYARINAFVRIFVDNRAETIIIEANSLSDMTPATCIYHQAVLNGYKSYDFIRQDFGFCSSKRK